MSQPKYESYAKIAFVGRLDSYHKGLDIALKALCLIKNQGHKFKFTIFGEGPDLFYLNKLVLNLGLTKDVVFSGYVSDIRKVWIHNEILFIPSRMEGCAVAMTEAMGFGRPAIATAVGGPSLIKDGVNGFIAEAAETSCVVKALTRALESKSHWHSIRSCAYETIINTIPGNSSDIFLEEI